LTWVKEAPPRVRHPSGNTKFRLIEFHPILISVRDGNDRIMHPEPTPPLSNLEFALLNSFQRDFPLLPRPFAVLADQLGCDEQTVIETLQRLRERGAVSRVGAVFQANAIGASALAALRVPAARLEQVARHINAIPEVNHNYEREHPYNLWFVVTAASAERLQAVLREIEHACQCGSVLKLPMREQYHIDLGFDLSGQPGQPGRSAAPPVTFAAGPAEVRLSDAEQILVASLQDGLQLVAEPFAHLGLPQEQALDTISRWQEQGIVKRFGVIVRHHELGYTANAMAVWDVPDAMVSQIGKHIAASGRVTLCYRRTRQLPEWRYNLFCMIHGKDRAEVGARMAALSEACGLAAFPHDVLFSSRRFKQRGAHYAVPAGAAHG
jgi:siroheme decarboxylase